MTPSDDATRDDRPLRSHSHSTPHATPCASTVRCMCAACVHTQTVCTPRLGRRTWPAARIQAPTETLSGSSHATGKLQRLPHLFAACLAYGPPGRHPGRPRVSVQRGARSPSCCIGVCRNERSQRRIDSVLGCQNRLRGNCATPPQLAATIVVLQQLCQRRHSTRDAAEPHIQTSFACRYQLLAAGNRARRTNAGICQSSKLSAHLVERAKLGASISLP